MEEKEKEKHEIQYVESRIITLRNRQVIIDRDVAELYGVETRDINKAVKKQSPEIPRRFHFHIATR